MVRFPSLRNHASDEQLIDHPIQHWVPSLVERLIREMKFSRSNRTCYVQRPMYGRFNIGSHADGPQSCNYIFSRASSERCAIDAA